jgi:PAS domain S-box-containing protein
LLPNRPQESRSRPAGAPVDVSLNEWLRRVSAARERLTVETRGVDQRSPLQRESSALVDELALAFEELQVAEEELQVQTEELSISHSLLEAERSRYQSLFESAPIPYLLTDANATIRDVNRAASRLMRVGPERLRGKPLAVFLDPRRRRRFRDRISALLAQPDATATLHFWLRRRGARPRFMHATAAAVRDRHGKVVELRWLLVDETARRRRERRVRSRSAELEVLVEQRTAELSRAIEVQTELAHEAQLARDCAERASREKSELIAIVSHELRTPLAAIGGYAELLALGVRGPLSESQRADAQRILEAQSHVLRLVDDLVGYAKLESGRLRFDITDVILGDAIQGIVSLVRPQAATKQIELAIEPCSGDIVIRADEERLRQIVLNLLANAIKFTPNEGRVTIAATVSADAVEIVIRDTGVGIPAEKLEAVFEPYVQLDATRDARMTGWGLGLAISRDMARAMGGELSATSTPGEGAAFALRLPRSTRIALGSSRA